ncbi:unnamed protein product [Blepharisma stoltei]|uniref:Par3/HAL N-terminal domain-containing protein n=1 Tax=Blepharisma stoltei TaxID=1481888 RepID=A0AAU9J4Q9_9CILI|nr:unnamed protein product [Blepharisma stoltei]
MKINIHISGQTLVVDCANGRQKIHWLGSVAIHRIDKNYGLDLGMFRVIQSEDGQYLNLESHISDLLKDNSQVWVVLQGEDDPIKHEESKRDPRRGTSPNSKNNFLRTSPPSKNSLARNSPPSILRKTAK